MCGVSLNKTFPSFHMVHYCSVYLMCDCSGSFVNEHLVCVSKYVSYANIIVECVVK